MESGQNFDIDWVMDEPSAATPLTSSSDAAGTNWRALVGVVLGFAALLGVFIVGQSTGRTVPAASLPVPVATAIATPTAEPTAAAVVDTPLELVDLIGEGEVVNELDLVGGGRVVLFCRETVPSTEIQPLLSMIHLETSPTHGEQLMSVEELARPRLASNSCAQCGGDKVDLNGETVLIGSCVHGAPFSAGSAYVIASPASRTHTPLALHLSCGITAIRHEGDRVVIDAEAPLIRGLHQTRFPLPSIALTRVAGEFVADDLELLNWNCDLFRSTQLAKKHLLRDEPLRSISYERTESSIGLIGLHGPMVIGLTSDTCAQLTDAWWSRPAPELLEGSPIADFIGLDPLEGQRDWFYTCQLEQ